MKFSAYAGLPSDIRCDLLTIVVFEGSLPEDEDVTAIDRPLNGLLGRLVTEEDFKGKKWQTLLVHTHGKINAQRILLIGGGKKTEFSVGDLRHAAGRGIRAAKASGARICAFSSGADFQDERSLQAIVEGSLLGRYRFDRYLGADAKRPDLLESAVVRTGTAVSNDAFQRASRTGEIVASAVARARDWVNEPAAAMTPRQLAEESSRQAQELGLEVKILGPGECRELGMGMYLAVAQGSDAEPRFIHIVYRPKAPAKKRICLVGKGVTFDSGGLSLKTLQGMEDMKTDMSGAAAVLNAITALAKLEAPCEVHAIAACTENMPSGRAYKIGDVLRAMNGKTVEINNTDAEGRLTLGDALAYAVKLEPDEIFDLATLTGACVVALGPHTAGVMSNDSALANRFLDAARRSGEDMWLLPLPERIKEQLKSEIADLRNTGDRYGGALTAGLFLREFVGKIPWVHVDLAGPASADKEYGHLAKGGTGFAVATLVEYLTSQ